VVSGSVERSLLLRIQRSPFQQLREYAIDIHRQSGKGYVIRFWPDSNDDIGSYFRRKKTRPHQLPQAAFYPVARNRRLAKSGNDQPDTGPRGPLKQERGSDDPNLE